MGGVHLAVMYIVFTTAKWPFPAMYHSLHLGVLHTIPTSSAQKKYYDVHFGLDCARFLIPLSVLMFPGFEILLPTYALGWFSLNRPHFVDGFILMW
jgi:hypothetical protein